MKKEFLQVWRQLWLFPPRSLAQIHLCHSSKAISSQQGFARYPYASTSTRCRFPSKCLRIAPSRQSKEQENDNPCLRLGETQGVPSSTSQLEGCSLKNSSKLWSSLAHFIFLCLLGLSWLSGMPQCHWTSERLIVLFKRSSSGYLLTVLCWACFTHTPGVWEQAGKDWGAQYSFGLKETLPSLSSPSDNRFEGAFKENGDI